MIWAGEVYYGFDGGIEKFSREYQRSGQDDNGPITRGNLQPQANDEDRRCNGAVYPRIALSLQSIMPPTKGVMK